MHACKINSAINSNNNYYITFCFLNEDKQNEIDINSIVNYIRLNYKINNVPFIAEYDNIEHEVIKTTETTSTITSPNATTTITTSTLITYKLLLKKLNDKLKILPSNTDAEIIVFFKKEITEPSLMISK